MDIIERAKELERLGEKEKSAETYLEASKITGEAWTAGKAGDIYLSLGKIEKAKKAYDRIIDCGIYPLYDYLIDFYLKIKDFNKASELFEHCFPMATHSKKLAFADKLFKLNAFREAEFWYLSSVGNVYDEKNPYLTKVGECKEKLGFTRVKKISKADGYFFQGDYRNALSSYRGSVKTSKYAKTKTAECYFMLKDYANAEKLYRELAQETDDAYYMFMLGECYNSEDIDANTLENAVYWFEYSLEKGSDFPCYHLGICYQFGRGTEKNLEKAVKMFEMGAKSEIDTANCLCKLGNIYYNEGDIEKATKFYREAAGLGNLRALLNIAIAYFDNVLPIFSYEEIKCFLAKAASLGSKRAYDMLIEIETTNGKKGDGERV